MREGLRDGEGYELLAPRIVMVGSGCVLCGERSERSLGRENEEHHRPNHATPYSTHTHSLSKSISQSLTCCSACAVLGRSGAGTGGRI